MLAGVLKGSPAAAYLVFHMGVRVREGSIGALGAWSLRAACARLPVRNQIKVDAGACTW